MPAFKEKGLEAGCWGSKAKHILKAKFSSFCNLFHYVSDISGSVWASGSASAMTSSSGLAEPPPPCGPREPKLQCEKPGWLEAFLTPPSHTNVSPFSWQFHWEWFMFFFHVCHPPAYSVLTWLLNNIELGLSRQQDTWLTTGGISADNMGLN